MIKALIMLIERNHKKFPDIDKCPICTLREGSVDILLTFSPPYAIRMVDHVLEHMAKVGLLKKVMRKDGEVGYEAPPELVRYVLAKYTERTGIV